MSTIGFWLFLAFLAGFFVLFKKSKDEHLSEELAFDIAFYSLFFAFITSRLFFVLFSNDLTRNFYSYISIFSKPGLSFWGTGIGVIFVLVWQANKNKLDFYKLADIFVFPLIIFQFFSAWGLYLDGSYQGREASMILPGGQVHFHHFVILYESVILFGLYCLMHKLNNEYRTFSWYKGRKGEAKPGFLLLAFLILMSLSRLLLAVFKTYPLYLRNIDIALSFFVFVGGIFLFYLRSGIGENTRQVLMKRISFSLPELSSHLTMTKRKSKNKFKAGKDAV